MQKEKVYLGLGANIGSPSQTLSQALDQIAKIKEIDGMQVSYFYETTPVSDIPQGLFVNAACAFFTTLSPSALFEKLEAITRSLGQGPKPKNAARIIDIDILHYGNKGYKDLTLEIPHPRWSERLFVLVPLLDLTSHIEELLPSGKILNVDLKHLIENFENIHHEKVVRVNQALPNIINNH